MKNEMVEIIEVWETEKSGEFQVGKRLISRTANGYLLNLAEGFALERYNRSAKELELLTKQNTK